MHQSSASWTVLPCTWPYCTATKSTALSYAPWMSQSSMYTCWHWFIFTVSCATRLPPDMCMRRSSTWSHSSQWKASPAGTGTMSTPEKYTNDALNMLTSRCSVTV
jgi:hypothetical protein